MADQCNTTPAIRMGAPEEHYTVRRDPWDSSHDALSPRRHVMAPDGDEMRLRGARYHAPADRDSWPKALAFFEKQLGR